MSSAAGFSLVSGAETPSACCVVVDKQVMPGAGRCSMLDSSSPTIHPHAGASSHEYSMAWYGTDILM